MIPSKIIGKTSGENWVGIIDATYGIILTLLVIELPATILELAEKDNSHVIAPAAFVAEIGVLAIGYFAIFTVIYDIWSCHKTLLLEARNLRIFSLFTGWILFLSSLVPPFGYLVNHFAIGMELQSTNHRALLEISRICTLSIISIIYLLLAALGKSEKRLREQTQKRSEELEYIFGTSLTKGLIAMLFSIFIAAENNRLPIIVMAILTYFPINLFKKWNHTAGN